MGRGREGREWWQFLGLVVLTAVAGTLAYLALDRDLGDDSGFVADPGAPSASSSTAPSGDATPSGPVTTESVPAAPAGVEPPEVADKRLTDFTQRTKLPDGSALVDLGDNAPGLAVTDAGLTHGPGTEGGLGVLEVELKTDVQALGFRVRFPGEGSGAAFLSAAGSSYAASDPVPTGIVLTVRPDGWALAVGSGPDSVLATGQVPVTDGAVEYRLIRDGDRLFVLDPTGETTSVEEASVAASAGPWGAWGLREDSPEEQPAIIELVSVG